jgi:hypothetical protein
MLRKKLPYREGDWLTVPLLDNCYALGLVARMDGKGIYLTTCFIYPMSSYLPKRTLRTFRTMMQYLSNFSVILN